jgi:hypothetical protein
MGFRGMTPTYIAITPGDVDDAAILDQLIPKRSERSGTNLLVPFPSECWDRGGKLSLALVEIPRP